MRGCVRADDALPEGAPGPSAGGPPDIAASAPNAIADDCHSQSPSVVIASIAADNAVSASTVRASCS
jgi:hypothetical protein